MLMPNGWMWIHQKNIADSYGQTLNKKLLLGFIEKHDVRWECGHSWWLD